MLSSWTPVAYQGRTAVISAEGYFYWESFISMGVRNCSFAQFPFLILFQFGIAVKASLPRRDYPS